MSKLFQKFKQDILGILLLAGGLFVALSLASFHPSDPSFNSIGQGIKVLNYCGYVGSFLADALFQLFGLASWLFVAGLIRMGVLSFQGERTTFKDLRLIWASLLILTLSCLVAVYFPEKKLFQDQIYLGGIIGMGLSQALIKAFNGVGVQVILWSASTVLVVFYSEKTLQELVAFPRHLLALIYGKVKKMDFGISPKLSTKKPTATKKTEASEGLAGKFNLKSEKSVEAEAQKEDETIEVLKPIQFQPPTQLKLKDEEDPHQFEDPASEDKPQRRKVVMKTKIQRHVENWNLPKLSILEDPPATRFKIDEKEIRRKAETLADKLKQFSVTGEVVAAKPGPAVTMFEYKPVASVKISKITELEDDLSMALSSESLRILAPIPGRDVVGIETSNAQRETVYLKDMLADDDFWKEDLKLPIALGKQANGEPKIVDLRKMPHLMVAGTTGSGKSVFVVSAITGLLFKHSPKTLRLIMIDPKQVDLAAFEKIPHLAMPTVVEPRHAVNALKWAVREMEKRYKSMSKFGARGLEAYNESVSKLTKEQIEEHEKINLELEGTPGKKTEQYYCSQLPYIVIVVEEFGDLMTVDKANVETSVVRLAQKARACGIHLILALQSPRKEVVTGLIKTNIPGRISFKVSSSMDSRIILDEKGAERLLANGDMLYKSPGGSSLVRHHGPFLKDAEINEVAKFWADQAEPEYDQSALKAMESGGGAEGGSESEAEGGEFGDDDYDDRYDEILSWAAAQKEVSASLIQRRFRLGYPRAARIIETFEREGVVGPAQGSKPRQVLVNDFSHLAE